MEHSKKENDPQRHIKSIFEEYTTPSRVLRSFTNLSNTVIETALSGQSKFVFEILQNADDAFEDLHQSIQIKFFLQDNYFIVSHNGKGFDYNDVERICDYASQIEEVKATDLSKTGYKGLGFKSLFNLSDCIYIYSNGYSFRFDKTYWPDSENKPWQVIPIWCKYNELPLRKKFLYDKPVNFILKVKDVSKLERQLRELINQPELLLYLHRINKLSVHFNEEKYFLERRIEEFGVFNKVEFYKNQQVESTWLLGTYKRSVFREVQKLVRGASRFIYPEKIKNAKEVHFTFALRINQNLKEISKIRGLCFSTLPTQLYLSLPYHTNSLFILNLDRTQLHENEWNEFLINQMGYLQFCLLKDLAEVNYLKNYVIQLFVRKINHTYGKFSKTYLKGFNEAKGKIGWLPDHQGKRLLKLGEAWIDDTEFFKQNFQKIRDHTIYPFLINYDVKDQYLLFFSEGEAKHFTYDELFRDFSSKYYDQLTKGAYINFINYLFEKLKGPRGYSKVNTKLKKVPFLVAKDKTLLSPTNALLEESENLIPHIFLLNPVDNDYLPKNNINLIKDWLVFLGARRLTTPIEVIRESILKWMESGEFDLKVSMKNHIGIISYLSKCIEHLTKKEMELLRKNLIILTENKQFKTAKECYLPDVVSIKELSNIISDEEKISSLYNMNELREFFIHVGVQKNINAVDMLRRSILMWIKNGDIKDKLTINNYPPIIEFVSMNSATFEYNLTEKEKMELKKFPVLTCDQIFQKAQVCYFDSAVPHVKGFENIILKDKLVSFNEISNSAYKFLKKIGVLANIDPIDVIRRSVLKWIHEGEITNRITKDNHHDILKYIRGHWATLKGYLSMKERKALKRMPILTESGIFRAASNCYWPVSNFNDNYCEEIPALESVVSPDEFVSSGYNLKEIKDLLEDLGVHNLTFTNIYEKYTDHLTHRENVKWFFSKLVYYWKRNNTNNDELLSYLQQKFCTSSCLLAKNGKMYSSKELYSSRFDNIHDIDPNSILLLEYEKLPEDLERFLGFKIDLDFKCIKQLLKAIEKRTELGNRKTLIFFTTILEQLRHKDKYEIKKHQLSLLSKENKLIPAKDLYYFIEENATCFLDSCYLNRIHGMTHHQTLELAQLCGVNTLPFRQEIKREKETYDSRLKEFYLERLSFIVVQESKKLNEDVNATLKRLYETICAIKLYQCNNIYVKYPFGEPTKIRHHFDHLTFYVDGKWVKSKSKIHDYLKKKLDLKTDIRDIIDMEQPITQNDIEEWYSYQKEDLQKYSFVVNELKKLLSGEEEKEKVTIAQLYRSDSDEEHFKVSKLKLLVNKEELTSGESSDESWLDHADDEPFLTSKQEMITRNETTIDSIKRENPEKFDFVEEELKKLLYNEEKNKLDTLTPVENKTATLHHSKYEKPDLKVLEKLLKNKEFTADESSSSESSVDDTEEIYTIKDEDSDVSDYKYEEPDLKLLDKLLKNKEFTADEPSSSEDEDSDVSDSYRDRSEIMERWVAVPESVTEENIKDGIRKFLLDELGIDSEKKQRLDIPVCSYSSTGSLHTGTSVLFQKTTSDHSKTKWLNEKYVFTFLMERYKKKYPQAQFDLSDGIFTLLSHKIEIVWLNANEEKGKSYDLLLKKEGKIKQLIEVKSIDEANTDRFNISHQTFTEKISQLATEFSEHKEKYCIYFVFNANNASTVSVVELNKSIALYKLVSLNNP